MSPPSINGHCHWALEELERIVIYNGVETNQSAVVYQTKNTSYKLGELDLRKKNTTRLLYNTRLLHMHNAEAVAKPPVKSTPRLYADL